MSAVHSVSLNSQNYVNNKCKPQSFTAKPENEQPKTDTQPSKDTFRMKKTHAGLITGGIISAVGITIGVLLSGFKNPKLLLNCIPMLAGAAGDFLTNRNREKFNADVQEQGVQKTYISNKKTEKTRSDVLYLKDNSGKQVGAGVGALGGLIASGIVAKKGFNIKLASKAGVATLAAGAAIYSLGGFIQGAISDACANRAAKKHAEKFGLQTL